MNVKTIIIPWKNKKDLEEIPEEYRAKLNFIAVKTFDEVLEVAIIGWKERKAQMKKKSFARNKETLPPAAA